MQPKTNEKWWKQKSKYTQMEQKSSLWLPKNLTKKNFSEDYQLHHLQTFGPNTVATSRPVAVLSFWTPWSCCPGPCRSWRWRTSSARPTPRCGGRCCGQCRWWCRWWVDRWQISDVGGFLQKKTTEIERIDDDRWLFKRWRIEIHHDAPCFDLRQVVRNWRVACLVPGCASSPHGNPDLACSSPWFWCQSARCSTAGTEFFASLWTRGKIKAFHHAGIGLQHYKNWSCIKTKPSKILSCFCFLSFFQSPQQYVEKTKAPQENP